MPRGRLVFGASAPHRRLRSPVNLVGHQAIGHSAEAKQCPIVCCRGRHPGPTPPPPPFRAHQVRRLRGRGVLAAVAAWAVAGSRWPCWWWVVRGCRRCCVWCGRRRGPTSCVPARGGWPEVRRHKRMCLYMVWSASCGCVSCCGILLGLLAKIKCSICSYQFNIWYTGH